MKIHDRILKCWPGEGWRKVDEINKTVRSSREYLQINLDRLVDEGRLSRIDAKKGQAAQYRRITGMTYNMILQRQWNEDLGYGGD